MECCSLDYGDVVRVCEDMAEVHRLQSEHGGWTDDMALVHYVLQFTTHLFCSVHMGELIVYTCKSVYIRNTCTCAVEPWNINY